MPLLRSACQYVQVFTASTGLPSQRSASAATLRERQVRAHLQDQLDARIVHFAHCSAQSLRRLVRHQQRAVALQAEQVDDLEAAVGERTANLCVAGRHVRRDQADAPDAAIALNRGLAGLGAKDHLHARARFEVRLQAPGSITPSQNVSADMPRMTAAGRARQDRRRARLRSRRAPASSSSRTRSRCRPACRE